MTDTDVDFADERVAELYGCFSPHARASSSSLPALPSAPATSMGDATTVVMAPVMQIMPELQQMCEEPVSQLLGEHLQGGSLVPSVVALAPAPTTPGPSQASLYEEKSCRDSSVMHSPKPIGLMVPVGEDIVVAGVVCLILGPSSPPSFVIFLQNWMLQNLERRWMSLEGESNEGQMQERWY